MNRIIVIIGMVLLALLAVSCGDKEKIYYYSRAHLAPFYTSTNEFYKKTTYSLNWGDKLLYLDEVITNLVDKNLFIEYVKVKYLLEDTDGYVERKHLIQNPIAKGVILEPTIIYNTPTITSRDMQTVIGPILFFVIETNLDWFKIEPYNTLSIYDIDAKTTKVYNNLWIQAKDVTTNNTDVDIIVALQFRAKEFNSAKLLMKSNPSYKLEEYITVLKDQMAALDRIVGSYRNSPSIGYANRLLDMIEQEIQTNEILSQATNESVLTNGDKLTNDAMEDLFNKTESILKGEKGEVKKEKPKKSAQDDMTNNNPEHFRDKLEEYLREIKE